MNTITNCDNCPFYTGPGEYDEVGKCTHPLNHSNPFSLESMLRDKRKTLNPKSSYKYNYDCIVVPKSCPLRSLKKINIGIVIPISLDPDLFEETIEAKING